MWCKWLGELKIKKTSICRTHENFSLMECQIPIYRDEKLIIKLGGSIIWICSRQQGGSICFRQLMTLTLLTRPMYKPSCCLKKVTAFPRVWGMEMRHMAKMKNEISIRSSAAEYITYVASVGEQ